MSINNIATFEFIIEELIVEGNYEIRKDGIWINMDAGGTFLSTKDLKELVDEDELSETTRNKIACVVAELG